MVEISRRRLIAASAMLALAERADWREDLLVRRFSDDILPQIDANALDLAAMLQFSASALRARSAGDSRSR